MKITILTLFPEMFHGPLTHSIVKRAQEKRLVQIEYINIRDFGIGKHQLVDDTAFGGGIGMVMRVDVVHRALEAAKDKTISDDKRKIILMSASGRTYNQTMARDFSELEQLIIICGHYEGIDDRIKRYIDEEVSIGDFVLTGGELPAMLIADSVTRLVKGVLKDGATDLESFSLTTGENTYLEYPHYTQPRDYDGQSVPDVLVSGDHKKIQSWRDEQAKIKTEQVRPDLLKETRSK